MQNISNIIFSKQQEKYGKVALVHVDAHTDMYGSFCGADIHHGNSFLLAVQEDLIDCQRAVQIGLRGTGYGKDYDVGRSYVRLSVMFRTFRTYVLLFILKGFLQEKFLLCKKRRTQSYFKICEEVSLTLSLPVTCTAGKNADYFLLSF